MHYYSRLIRAIYRRHKLLTAALLFLLILIKTNGTSKRADVFNSVSFGVPTTTLSDSPEEETCIDSYRSKPVITRRFIKAE